MEAFLRSAPSYCFPLSFTPAHSWRVIHHRRRPLSFLWLGWLAGWSGWLARLAGLLAFWLSGPWTRVSRLLRLLLGPMYSFYSYTGAVPTCSSGSAGRSFSPFAYRYSRISPGRILVSATGRDIRAHPLKISTDRAVLAHACTPSSSVFSLVVVAPAHRIANRRNARCPTESFEQASPSSLLPRVRL